jgi:catechol 2,3-dioxygenase-like lactoylglutathione lyase family enzyme
MSHSTLEMPVGEIDRSIYVMPAFLTLPVVDFDAARTWYVDGLGFVVLAEMPGPEGTPWLVHLRRYRYQDILLVPGAAARTAGMGSGLRFSVANVHEDLAQRAEQARRVGTGTVEGPVRRPWNAVELVCRDPEGHEVVFTEYGGDEHADPALVDAVRASIVQG